MNNVRTLEKTIMGATMKRNLEESLNSDPPKHRAKQLFVYLQLIRLIYAKSNFMKSEKQQATAAKEFARRWEVKGYEKGQSQPFWMDLLSSVYGMEIPGEYIKFEEQVHLDHTSFIEGYIDTTRVMIEQKSLGLDLRAPIRQSDGSMLNPFQQAQRYMINLPVSKHPRWIVTCNFSEFDLYDMENPKGEPNRVLLKDLEHEYYRLQFLVESQNEHIEKELEVSMQAGELVGKLYGALVKQYDEKDPESMRFLNILCVRLVFCLYAEDAGIFGRHDIFHDYLSHYAIEDMRAALVNLFLVLNTPEEKRSKYLKPDLAAFPYTNGGLFAEEIDVPQFTDEIKDLLLRDASLGFDWSVISPTIFGGVFEGTLNPETRRSGGMHYTSIENIRKVIDPLFMNSLNSELAEIKEEKVLKKRIQKLHDFQNKLGSLTFFDPACGSGNFLTETYLCLRRLENDVIANLYSVEPLGAFDNPIKVSIHQFYGIEINDFAVSVATTALWISESQMIAETERIIKQDIKFLPLENYSNIREGNSLRIDWKDIIQPEKLDYIIGNPPFVGARIMGPEQKADVAEIFKGWKNSGNLDYVSCWYKKAVDYMVGTKIEAALVSTNSVTQGDSVAILWKPLFGQGIRFNFAYRTFIWDSESHLKAHVHCVIIGFSYVDRTKKEIWDGKRFLLVDKINGYLINGDDVFVESRQKPLCQVPEIGIGNQPVDGGNYLFTKEEKDAFIAKEHDSAPLFHPWYGAVEFLHRAPRYCLWLGECTPAELHRLPNCLKRVAAVRELRLASKRSATRNLGERPTHFLVENMPKGSYILIPRVSSENRRYIPMGFMHSSEMASDAVHIIPDAEIYHFGILESNVHMAWMRAVCGRLKSDFRYSKEIVYNNFPWPTPTAEQKAKIEAAAQAILDAREKYPDSSLAELYDELLMPTELRKAHQGNDRAVMAAYGFSTKMTESECVSKLFGLYDRLTKQ